MIPSDKFVPSNAPYLDGSSEFLVSDSSKEWQCSSVRVVYDDVHCSQVTDLRPGDEVAFWGYRSDGQNHVWEENSARSTTELEGPADTSPNAECGNWVQPEENESPQEDKEDEDPTVDPVPMN